MNPSQKPVTKKEPQGCIQADTVFQLRLEAWYYSSVFPSFKNLSTHFFRRGCTCLGQWSLGPFVCWGSRRKLFLPCNWTCFWMGCGWILIFHIRRKLSTSGCTFNIQIFIRDLSSFCIKVAILITHVLFFQWWYFLV